MIVLRTEMMKTFFRVSAWEKTSPARRLLCAFGRVFVLLTILVLVAYVLLPYQYRIEAKVWHWRHGYTTSIGSYETPVPDHWVILSRTATFFTMVNTMPIQVPRDGKFHTAAVLTVDVGLSETRAPALHGANWIDSWVSLEHQRLAKQKVEPVVETTLNLNGESITCLGGKELNSIVRDGHNLPETDIVSIHCMSDRGLELLFVGEPSDVQSFYAAVSQIRRKS